jgi:HD-like signal output (HDOD) protein
MSNVCAPTYQSGRASNDAATAARAAAFQFLSQLAAELTLGAVNLPCFPNVVLRIRIALSDPQSTPEKTVMIVGAEPRLAARILQTANSAVFNPTGKPVTDLRAAITRLGHRLVQSAAMAFAVQQMKSDKSLRSVAVPLSKLWEKSIAVASVCEVLARRTRVSRDLAFLTGLLHGIGRLYIMVRTAVQSNSSTYDEALIELIADWHPSIGKLVLENWGFMEEMVEAVANQSDYQRKPKRSPDLHDVLIAGTVLGEVLQDRKPDLSRCAGVSAFATLGLTPKDCIPILKHTRHQLDSLHEALGC